MDSLNRIIDGQGFVLLNGEIDAHNSAMIAQELYDMKAMGLQTTLKINSGGGSVLGAFTIIDAIKTTETDTHIVGLAASAAGVIAQFGKRRLANDNAIGMIHPPTGNNAAVLEMVRTSLKASLTGRSKLTVEEIDNMMKEGAPDAFFSASEMLNKGLIDEIIPTHEAVEIPANSSKEELFNIYNKLITNDEQMTDLDITNELKSLRKEKEVISDKVTDLETKNSAITKDLESAKAENETLSKEIAIVNKAKAEILIENAHKAGKVKKENCEKMVLNAIENYDMVKDTLDGIQVSNDLVVEDLLNTGGASQVKTFNEMSDDEQADLARSNPELYNKEVLNEK